jgi:dihydrofolate reductase
MRNVLVSEAVTLDGYFAGPNGEIDWHVVDDEFNAQAAELLDSVDTLLFGRVTYQLMAAYWPTPAALTDDPIIAAKMNALQKVVFSRTLKAADWNNSRLASKDLHAEITTLKQQPGKDMVIFGSGSLVSQLTTMGLLDEYRLFIHPVVLGAGKPLWGNLQDRLGLKLIGTRAFGSGNVLLTYRRP